VPQQICRAQILVVCTGLALQPSRALFKRFLIWIAQTEFDEFVPRRVHGQLFRNEKVTRIARLDGNHVVWIALVVRQFGSANNADRVPHAAVLLWWH
jgi:hypothetical protein